MRKPVKILMLVSFFERLLEYLFIQKKDFPTVANILTDELEEPVTPNEVQTFYIKVEEILTRHALTWVLKSPFGKLLMKRAEQIVDHVLSDDDLYSLCMSDAMKLQALVLNTSGVIEGTTVHDFKIADNLIKNSLVMAQIAAGRGRKVEGYCFIRHACWVYATVASKAVLESVPVEFQGAAVDKLKELVPTFEMMARDSSISLVPSISVKQLPDQSGD